jgi:Pyridoxamine 5'-phosphate oxidase
MSWSNSGVRETAKEIEQLQRVLDASALNAGPHLRDVITDDRRLTAADVCDELQGMRLLVLGTATADGRPLVGPVDGYFIHGAFFFSSGKDSVRMRHIAVRPFVSATYLPGEHLAITVHGRAELFEISDPQRPELRQAMLDHYVPLQGPSFEEWLNEGDSFGARIEAEKMFTFRMES